MTDRREFIQAGLAVSLLGGSALASAQAASLKPAVEEVVPLHKVLVDADLAESVAFGAEAARHGASIHTFSNGDITDFWYHELDLLWRQQRAPIAGLTRHGPLFVLERFAWDRGMRVVFRGEHGPAAEGVVHTLTGPQSTLVGAADLIKAGAKWPQAMANAVTHCVQGCSAMSGAAVSSAERLAQHERLHSWVIA